MTFRIRPGNVGGHSISNPSIGESSSRARTRSSAGLGLRERVTRYRLLVPSWGARAVGSATKVHTSWWGSPPKSRKHATERISRADTRSRHGRSLAGTTTSALQWLHPVATSVCDSGFGPALHCASRWSFTCLVSIWHVIEGMCHTR